MRLLALLALSLSLQGANYYVASASSTPAGSDSNNGAIGTPWLTLAHAVANVATNDVINIVADGNKVTCDATLPSAVTNITVQSTKLAMLQPVGYRVNPANDSANFGKCQMASTGILAGGETHGFSVGGVQQTFTIASSTFTITTANDYPSNGMTLANGSQVYFEINSELFNDTVVPGTTVPSPLTILKHYVILNCSVSPACGSQNSTFQVAELASPSTPITITGCDANCLHYGVVVLPVQADPTADTITSTDALGAVYANGTPITFGTAGVQLAGTLPAPLATNTIYYVCNLSSRTFKVGTASNCASTINITDVGAGMYSFSNANVPHGWKFSGIEAAPTSGTMIFSVFQAGNGKETAPLSMVDSFEFDRMWIHDFSNAQNGPRRAIYANGTNISLHDSYIDGMKDTNSDAQAIGGICAPGPITITNSFLEASGENILFGGDFPAYYPCANQNITISGNYLYKPFLWKFIGGAGLSAPSGACLWDSVIVDPDHHGGEFLNDTDHSQGYICSSGTWTTSGSIPNHYVVKNLYEHKNGKSITISGNVLQGVWVDAQAGQAFTMGFRNGSGPGAANDHITTTNNKVLNAYGFFTGGGNCTGVGSGINPCLATPSNHSFTNNLGVLSGTGYCGVPSVAGTCGTGMWAHLWTGNSSISDNWNHNTIVSPDGISGSPFFPTSWEYGVITNGPNAKHNQISYTNGIHSYDFAGSSGSAITEFAADWQNSTWSRMALIGAAGTYTGSAGTGNTMSNTALPVNTAAVGFVNTGTGDYHLSSSSPYSAANGSATLLSSDGTDLGVDIDALNAAISGAVAGTPTWAVQENFNVAPASRGAVITYTRPGSGACSLTIYNSPARISANENADTNTSGNKLDTRTGNVVSGSNITFNVGTVSALNPGTQYWYSLSCVAADMSTWLLAGDSFTTTGSGGGGSVIGSNVTVGANVVH